MQELLSYECERANSYKLLSECYYLPDQKLIDRLRSLNGSVSGLCSEIVNDLPKTGEWEPLTIDFSKLFLGPYKLLAPPYGSVYLEQGRKVMGDSTMDVKNRYREEGLNIALKETPDHITVELEFMYFLIFKQMEAINNSAPEVAADYLKKQLSFLDRHLGRWAPEFTEKVEANAKNKFYKNLAQLTKSFIKEDLKNLFAADVRRGRACLPSGEAAGPSR